MKFSTREDIEAPIADVFRAISDFDGFERSALRRGAEVSRTDALTAPGQGMMWKAQFPFRNRTRAADLELVEFDAPNSLALFTTISGLEAILVIDLVEMSRTRTRMHLSLDVKPKTISARLAVQSMRLAKANLTKKFRKRAADFAANIEQGYRTPGA